MNTDLAEAQALARGVVEAVGQPEGVQVAVCPPYISLQAVEAVLEETPVRLGAQDMHFEDEGAFTGEVSARMLRSVGCRYVILGHSERRQHFAETDATVGDKVKKALANELIPILCVGETEEQREEGDAESVVELQVSLALQDVPEMGDPSRLVIAYEPVWAIGTGQSATPAEAQAMHAFVRSLLVKRYGEAVGGALHILYGGSMRPSNAEELLSQPDINGGLIGGASLKAGSFAAIVGVAEAAIA